MIHTGHASSLKCLDGGDGVRSNGRLPADSNDGDQREWLEYSPLTDELTRWIMTVPRRSYAALVKRKT